jgi:hypothetical protein
MARRSSLPARVPLAQAGPDYPFAFRGQAYLHIADTWADGATKPREWSQAELEASWAAQHEAAAEMQRKREAREAEAEAAKQKVLDAKEAGHKADTEAKRRHDEAIQYVSGYTGTWGLPLDIKASQAWGTKWLKLTERQVDALLTGKARDLARVEEQALARELFADEEYLRHTLPRPAAPNPTRPDRTTPSLAMPNPTVEPGGYTTKEAHSARPATPEAPRLAPQRPAPAPVGRVEDGIYRTADGVIWKVQTSQTSGHPYAKRLHVDEPGRPGTFVFTPGAVNRLRPDQRLTLEDAKAFGDLYGMCCVCGRVLTDEKSIAAGIGPICAGRI